MSRALDRLAPEQLRRVESICQDAEDCTSYEEEIALLVERLDDAEDELRAIRKVEPA